MRPPFKPEEQGTDLWPHSSTAVTEAAYRPIACVIARCMHPSGPWQPERTDLSARLRQRSQLELAAGRSPVNHFEDAGARGSAGNERGALGLGAAAKQGRQKPIACLRPAMCTQSAN